MRFNWVMVFVVVMVFLTGCVEKQNTTLHNSNERFEKYNNTNHIVGNKASAIATLIYVQEVDDKIVDKITFYIDKFPYDVTFNLCQDMKSYRDFKTVFTDEKTKEKTPQYFQNSINCQSALNMQISQNDFKALIDFNLFDGFNIVNFDGFEKKLPVEQPFQSSGYVIRKAYDKQLIHQDIDRKQLIYFQFLQY
ncbi:hypothetical protein [Sulfurospirillum deleyianum]|uniref:Lipoprotein n=1 Tax=Sulfurospirillum deleyianum (strain ATCC 51133 / DSM 6946 / 5175) TaxID=525898 RepID=D1B137_SULD5|nr:hypothetical protein [Sulfurospirillum deleyianum]ACZ11807.1 hypothetical protein Sdel_0774 [Sulfurospirillum deleyianum DSM 6946]